MNSINIPKNEDSFFIYYGSAACANKLNKYETLILDPDNYKNVSEFNSFTYAYFSLGEVNHFRSYFKILEINNKLLSKNTIWDSYIVKFDAFWQNLILKEIIPDIIKCGYQGIMIDTVDTMLHNKICSNKEIIIFINKIKSTFPSLNIMLNRGFEIVNDLNIDSILIESTISTHNFETKEYLLHEESHRFDIKKSIKCYSVDYWHSKDKKMIDKIRNVAKEKGYIPLVTDIELQKLP